MMLIPLLLPSQAKGHWEPYNQVRSYSLVERMNVFKPRILRQQSYAFWGYLYNEFKLCSLCVSVILQ